MKYLIPALPLLIGFLLDALIGDPYSLPHPIRLIGRMIGALERIIRKKCQNLRFGGVLLRKTAFILLNMKAPHAPEWLIFVIFRPEFRDCTAFFDAR